MKRKSSVLLVEGSYDKYCIEEIFRFLGINKFNFEIKFDKDHNNEQKEGIEQLMRAFRAHLKDPEVEKIWLIVDADKNARKPWEQLKQEIIRQQLEEGLKYELDANSPFPNDNIVHPLRASDKTIGLWIMPDNSSAGMLEDFIVDLIEDNDSLIQEARNAVTAINTKRETLNYKNLFKEVHLTKAELRTWFAWIDEPGVSFGVALKKGLLKLDNPVCKKFINWLKILHEGE